MSTSCEHVTPRYDCPRCEPNLPDLQPASVDGLLRILWLEQVPIDEQRLQIRALWDEPECRPVLEPLAAELRGRGLL
jgi:hypothetical protein